MAKRGVVPVEEKTGIGWYPLSYTIKDGGKRKLKVEYAIEKLGSKHVSEKLRAGRFVELNRGNARIAGNFETLYLEMLDKLVEEARELDALEF
jgi:NADPH-dependent 2,4-dienoyl-CoA reductase/sulfur reductase-like enzyme